MFYPKVSIIIPVYNGKNYLSDAINSALNQTYDNVEVIVINDGSNDNGATEKISLSFGNKINYIYKKNGGVSTALNLGITKSSGEYISWLSHDDIYYPNKIQEEIYKLQNCKDKNKIIFSNIDIIDSNGNIKKPDALDIKYVNEKNFLYNLVSKHIINGCTLLIPKQVFQDIGYFNTSLLTVQDYEMWFRMYLKYRFIKIESSLVQSRHHIEQDSRSSIKFIIMMKEERAVYKDFIKKNGLNKIFDSYNGSIYGFIKDFIIKIYFKIFIFLPIFIFIGKYRYGQLFIAKIRPKY